MRIISACYDGMFVVSFEMASFYESIRDRLWSAAFLVTLWDLMLLMVVDMWIRMATHDNFFFHSKTGGLILLFGLTILNYYEFLGKKRGERCIEAFELSSEKVRWMTHWLGYGALFATALLLVGTMLLFERLRPLR